MIRNNKTILISTMGQVLAHCGRTLLIGRELRERGYNVLFSGQGRYLNLIEDDGFSVISIDGLDGKRMLRKSRKKMVGVDIFTAEAFESLIHTDLLFIEETQPDLIIFDLQPSMGVAAPISGIPSVSVVNAFINQLCCTPT